MELIREGNEEGIFHSDYPDEAAEMIMIYATTLLDSGLIELTQEEQYLRIKALFINMERMLGCKAGDLKECMRLLDES